MTRYIARRLVGLIPNVLLMLALVVILIELIPGDIVDLLVAESFGDTDAARAAFQQELGLDRPLAVRYLDYAWGALQGDLGTSLYGPESVVSLIGQRAFVTLEVSMLATMIGVVVGVGIGVMSAVNQESPLDYTLRSIAILGISIPNFAIATAVVIFPAIWWGFAPNLRFVHLWEDPIAHLKILILPSLILSTGLAASLMRLTRTTMLEVLRQDYIRTARAKGVSARTVITTHALRNAFIPVLTLMGISIAFLISGTVIMESVFAIPGVGLLLLNAINKRDYPLIQGIVLMIGVWVMLTNLVIDVLYVRLDPRIRFS